MSDVFRCPECGSRNHVFSALNESLLAISSDLASDVVLQRIVDVARQLVHASYGAVAIADEKGGISRFITSGEWPEGEPLQGAEPILASLSNEARPYATADIGRDGRLSGWPQELQNLRSLLSVPIVTGGAIVGCFYLANENAWGFSRDHQSLVELLAPHAGLTIRNVRLYERSRELSVVQERNRLARELHDSVTQTLFSMKLAAESASVLVEEDAPRALEQLADLKELAQQASGEMRSLIFELRPPELEIVGLIPTLRKHIEVLARVHPADIAFRHEGDPQLDPMHAKEIFRIVQEALNNAVRHSEADAISVELMIDGAKLRAVVTDDGEGFDPQLPARSHRLGLISMRERAQAIGADLSISSAPGRGTSISLELGS